MEAVFIIALFGTILFGLWLIFSSPPSPKSMCRHCEEMCERLLASGEEYECPWCNTRFRKRKAP